MTVSQKRVEWQKKWRWGHIRHMTLVVFTVLAFVFAALILLLQGVFTGPSPSLSDQLVSSVTETSALKFLPYLFMGPDEVEAALARTALGELETVTDTSLYQFVGQRAATGSLTTRETEAGERFQMGTATVSASDASAHAADDPYGVGEGIEIVRIVGPTYRGYMAIIDDPSRVSVGVSSSFRNRQPGKRIEAIAAQCGAVLAVNGGAFEDSGGGGDGGTPLGLVISNGTLLNPASSYYTAIGFDQNDCLVIGNLSTNEAVKMGLRDAVGFGPALIVNGEPAETTTVNASLNPRTAIGQRADGAVLLLVVDGRQVNSLGASMADLIAVMTEYGAINAGNLDGGSSSVMIANGVQLNDGQAMTGSRAIPTAIVVR